MTCTDVVPMLTAFVDGELSADEQTLVSRHVASCPSCQVLLIDLQETTDRFADYLVSSVAAPLDFEQRVMMEIHALDQTRQANRLSWVPIFAAVLGIAAIVSLVLSPVGMVFRMLFGVVYRASGGLYAVPSFIGHWWMVVFAASAILLICLSVAAVVKLLRSVQSEALS